MSWEIFIQDLPAVASVSAIPADFRPGTIGTRSELVERILQAVPFAEQQDADWFFVRTPEVDLSFQINMEDTERVRAIVIHVHDGEQGAACAAAIIRATGQRALDTITGEFFDAHAPERSSTAWAAYRASVLGRN